MPPKVKPTDEQLALIIARFRDLVENKHVPKSVVFRGLQESGLDDAIIERLRKQFSPPPPRRAKVKLSPAVRKLVRKLKTKYAQRLGRFGKLQRNSKRSPSRKRLAK